MPDYEPSRRRHVLFLTPQCPYPPEQGTALRNYNLIAQLATRHAVSLLTFAEPGAPSVRGGPLADLCCPCCLIPVPARTMRHRLRTLLFSGDADMARRLHSPEYADALRDLLAKESFDIVQVEGIEMAPYGLAVRRMASGRSPVVVYDDHNAEYVLQRRAFSTDARRPERWLAALYSLVQYRRLAAFEAKVCRQADAVLAVSEADARALRALAPGVNPQIVPNGVDTQWLHPGLGDVLGLSHPAVVFTGKMDFRPNVDAMLWFHSQVWSRVRAEIPAAKLYVVGKNAHPRLAALASDSSVEVTGYVADTLPYFGGADLYIAPLRMGGGTRLKILEAMAAGLPLVATTLGAEGIDLENGRHALLADTPEDFCHAVLTLLRDRSLATRLGIAARELILERYSWERIAPLVDAVYSQL